MSQSSSTRHVIGRLLNTGSKQHGHLEVLLEIFIDNERVSIYPVNQHEYFCDSGRVFITSGYSELEKKYGNHSLVSAKVTENINTANAQRYVCRNSNISPLSLAECYDFAILEVIETASMVNNSRTVLNFRGKPATHFVAITSWYDDVLSIAAPMIWDDLGDDKIELLPDTKDAPFATSYCQDHYVPLIDVDNVKDSIYTFDLADGNKLRLLVASINTQKEFIDDEATLIDLKDDYALVDDEVLAILNTPPLKGLSPKALQLFRNTIGAAKIVTNSPERYKRAMLMVMLSARWPELRSAVFTELADTAEGKQFIGEYLDQNHDSILNKYLKKSTKKVDQELAVKRRELASEIETITAEKGSLTSEVEALAVQHADLKEQVCSARLALETELESLRNEQAALSHANREYTNLNNALRDRISNSYEEYLSACLGHSQIFSEAGIPQLHGNLHSVSIPSNKAVLSEQMPAPANTEGPTYYKVDFGDLVTERIRIIRSVMYYLHEKGRFLDYLSTARLVVTLVQNRLVVFQGPPGCGKTTLSLLLADALAISGDRSLFVPVAKGWQSSRDLIGYSNPVTNEFEPSATGFWPLLTSMASEDVKESTFGIAVLDEFNLSQPEFYLSSLMASFDPDHSRPISFGGQARLPAFPSHLRVIGTINNDETVHPLSERMTDRAATIHFDDLNYGSKVSGEASGPVTASDLERVFAPSGHGVSSQVTEDMTKVFSILQSKAPSFGHTCHLSHRKLKSMNDYVEVMSTVVDNRVQLVDSAICQFVIPVLKGSGDGFKHRLQALYDFLVSKDYLQASLHVERIIQEGGMFNQFTYRM